MNYHQFLKKARAQAARQGWKVEPVKKGYQFFPADKTRDPITLHRTPSDHRAYMNTRSRLRKAGLDI